MNRITLIIFLFFIISKKICFGQQFFGARSNSLANASVSFVDGWAYYHNPGAIGMLKGVEIGYGYENRFLLKEFQNQSLFYIQPIKKGVLSIGGQYFGFDAYRFSKIGGGYSLKLAENIAVGLQLNYQSLRLSSNYGMSNSLTAECGIYFKLNEQLKFGVSINNISRTKFSTNQNERFTSLIRLGANYQFSTKLMLAIELEKNIDYQPRFKIAMEYIPVKNFSIRSGIRTQSIEYTFGFGYKVKKIQLDFGSAYYQLIGWSPHISLTYKLH